ncbi:hypothetical protein J7L13_02435 [bacterium]|nr:hypothetical protein [bacterium]
MVKTKTATQDFTEKLSALGDEIGNLKDWNREVLEEIERLSSVISSLAEAVQGLMNESIRQRTQIQEIRQQNPDSITIGTPGNGQIKVYGDFNNPEAFRIKIDRAIELEQYAKDRKGA